MKFAPLLTLLMLAANAPAMPVNLTVGDGPDAMAEGTARLVGAIVGYTRWPEPVGTAAAPIRLCVVGPAAYAGQLGTWPSSGGPVMRRLSVSAKATDLPARCDAVYLGAMDLPAMQRITAQVKEARILTIAEDDPTCRSEAMVCLVILPRALTFQLNIDAVSRSGLSVDPRVLRLSRGFGS